MACFRRLPLRLFGGMQEAHSLVLARLQAPQTLHRSLARLRVQTLGIR
jgi:hypothetical protein